jgi:hypothetical protein
VAAFKTSANLVSSLKETSFEIAYEIQRVIVGRGLIDHGCSG